MRTTTVISILLTFIISLAAAVDTSTEREANIFAWPLSAEEPQSLATVSYTSTNATINTYTAPTIPSGDDIVRVGYFHPSGEWSGVATSASNFAPNKPKTLQLLVNQNAELYHLGFTPSGPVSRGKGQISTVDDLTVEVVQITPGPKPALNKPVVVTADGEEEKEPEKSFLQKFVLSLLQRSCSSSREKNFANV